MSTKMFKFLRLIDSKIKSNSGDHTWEVGVKYSLPDDLKPELCSVGFHASPTPLQALGYVKGEVLALVSGKGESDSHSDKTAFKSMKLIKTYSWTAQDSVDLAIFAAELVLPIFEAKYPNDDRPRKAIEAAKSGDPNAAAAAAAAADAEAAAEAAYAAETAAEAAACAYAAETAAEAAARAAYAAAYAAEAAACAAEAAARAACAAEAAAEAAKEITSQINKWIINRADLNDN